MVCSVATIAKGNEVRRFIVVTARDDQGNTATWFTGNVTIGIGANPSGGTISGTVTVAAVAGVATFSNLRINKAGTGYTLTATATGLPGATSAAFNITPGAPTQLVCTGGPTLLQVRAVDALGNTVTSYTGNVTVVLPGGGSTTVAMVAGVATFANLNIPSGGTVVFTSGALTVTCGPY